MNFSHRFSFVVTATLLVGAHALADPPQYKVVDITPASYNGVPVRSASAGGIAKNGSVFGTAFLKNNSEIGFRYLNGAYSWFSLPPDRVLQDVNSAGIIAGYVRNSNGTRAAIWNNGSATLLPSPANSEAYGITDTGVIAGWQETSPGSNTTVATTWQNESFTNLETPIGGASVAYAIYGNTVVGSSQSATSGSHSPTRWVGGKLEAVGPVGFPGYLDGVGAGGQFSGNIVYHSPDNTQIWHKAFVGHDSSFRYLDMLGRTNARTLGISADGSVLSSVWNQNAQLSSVDRASVLNCGLDVYDLGSLLKPQLSGDITSAIASDMNESGQLTIVGERYIDGLPGHRVLIATPVPEPSPFFLMSVGVLFLVVRLRWTTRKSEIVRSAAVGTFAAICSSALGDQISWQVIKLCEFLSEPKSAYAADINSDGYVIYNRTIQYGLPIVNGLPLESSNISITKPSTN